MSKFNKVALASVLSIAIVGGISWIGANTTSKAAETKTVAKPTVVKSEVTSNIDVSGFIDKVGLNVAYMDVFGAMRECKEGMLEAEKLEQKRKDLARGIETESKKLETAMAKFKTEASTLNDSARAKKEQELVKMKREVENLVQGSEEEMKLVMQQVTEALAKEVEQAVVAIAQKDKLDAVIDKVTGRVIYSTDKADYTSKVVQSMNKNYDVKLAQSLKGSKAVATA